MKNFYTALFAFLLSAGVSAQTFNYEFSAFTSDYEDLTDATLAIDYSWDDPNIPIPIGFSFSFEGLVNDTIYISDYSVGGMLVLDPLADPIDFLIAYSSDLTDAGYNEGEYLSPISYKTEGEPGYRICKIEWKEAAFYNEVSGGQTPANLVSFQLWLYENTNDFEIHFGPHTIKDFELVHDDGWLTTGIIQDIGLFEGNITMGHVTTGDPSNPTITSSAEEIILVTSGLYNNPSNGTVYRYGSNFVGVDEPETELGWSAFPNPTDGQLTLYTGNPEAVLFDVYDLAGRVITSGTIFNTEVMNIQSFESGIYLVRMTQGNEVKTVQIVKQ